MFAVDVVRESAPNFVAVPCMNNLVAAGTPVAECVHAPAALSDPADDLPEAVAEHFGWIRRGLLDIKTPKVIELVGRIDLDTCKFREFFLTDQTEPGAPCDQSLIPVYVEALISPQSFLAPGTCQFAGRDL